MCVFIHSEYILGFFFSKSRVTFVVAILQLAFSKYNEHFNSVLIFLHHSSCMHTVSLSIHAYLVCCSIFLLLTNKISEIFLMKLCLDEWMGRYPTLQHGQSQYHNLQYELLSATKQKDLSRVALNLQLKNLKNSRRQE